MSFRITFAACQKPDGAAPVSRVLDIGSVAHYFIGDYYYNDSAGTNTLNGVSFVPTVFGPTGNNTLARNLQRWVNVFGRQGLATYQALWDARDAGRIEVYGMPDDHDGKHNNYDHSLGAFKDSFNVASGTLSGQTDASLTQTDVLNFWKLGEQALGQIHAAYFDNQFGAPNGDIPSAMVGTAVASDFSTKYFYRDYGPAGEDGGTCLRVIVPDCISYKDPASNVDNGSKTMLGVTQMAWLKARIVEAAARGFKHTVIFWTKDLLNLDNGDGGAGYKTEVRAFLLWCHSNNYSVSHMTGDRHTPHASLARVSNGDAFDALIACACPFGQGTGGLTQYPENVWAYNQNDACVLGVVEVDDVAQTTILQIVDAWTMLPLFAATIPWGQRLPSAISAVQSKDFRPSASSLRTAPAVPASLAAYYNPLAVPVQIIVSGGTVTLVEMTRDGATWDPVGTSSAAFVLAAGDACRITYSVAPTKFVQYPLS